MNRGLFLAVVALIGTSGLVGCGGGSVLGGSNAFAEGWNDDQGASSAALWNRLKDAPVARGADIAIGVAGGKIHGVPLDGSPKWTASHALDARPVLAGGLVIASGGGSLLALDAKNGQKTWSLEAHGTLRGAGDDGALTAVVLGLEKGASILLIVDRRGQVVRRIETEQTLGVPAAVNGIVFVPWSSQYVSAIEASTGNEVARILVREKTSHAWTTGAHLYFGEMGIFRFDDKTRFSALNRASHVALAARELPGTPTLFPPVDQKVPVNATARDRIRLYARGADHDGMLTLDSGRYYGTYFRIVMGFDGARGGFAWAQTRTSDILGGAAGEGSLAVCDADGKVALIDGRTGGVAKELAIGEPIQSCVVQLDGLRAPNAPAPPLGEQLANVLLQKDPELATVQRLLLRELATIEDEVATKALIDLISDPKTPVPVMADARVSLAGRRNGSKYMIEALGRHYDFLKDVLVPPPSGPIAQALSQIKEPGAPAALASHLLDPATPDADLRHVAAALAAVARKDEVPTLKQFFAMYQGTAVGDDVESAVVSVGHALLKTNGADGRALVEKAIQKSTTVEGLKPKLKALLEAADTKKAAEGEGKGGLDAKPADAKPDAKPGAKPDAKPGAKPDAKPVDAKPGDAKSGDIKDPTKKAPKPAK
jgi:hypothetical protein